MSWSSGNHGQKTFGFGLKALKSHPELSPLVIIMAVAVGGVAAYCGYMFTKTDIVINKSAELPPWERVDPERRQKLIVVNQEYKRNEDLEKLKKEIREK